MRPKQYEAGSRIHIGVKHNRYMISLFDSLADKQGLDRTQAIEICMKAAIHAGRIPDPFFPDVEARMEEERQRQLAKHPVNAAAQGSRLFSGHRGKSDSSVKKPSKISQSL